MKSWIDLLRKGIRQPTRAKNHIVTTIEDTHLNRKNDYIIDYNEEMTYHRGDVLISYFVQPFHYFKFSPRFRQNSNRWQSYQIANIFNRLGFSVDIFSHARDVSPGNFDKYDVVFGVEPNFVEFAEGVSDDVLLMYYATGEHWSVRNSAEIERLKTLEERRGATLEPERQIAETSAESIADAIITIGDSTKESYLRYLDDEKPILPITISTHDSLASNAKLKHKNYTEAKKKFLWLGGSGFVLKGLDIALEIFRDVEELELYVCGGVRGNEEFTEEYAEELFETDNIHFVGWVDLDSKRFQRIANECAFHLYPSASDGIPSSLAMTMRSGLIPIAPMDILGSIDYWGVPLQNREIDHVKSVVRRISKEQNPEIRRRAIRAYTIGNTKFTRERYTQDMTQALETILEEFDVG